MGAADNPNREAARFSLNVWDESYVGGASAQDFSVRTEDQGDSVLVDVNVAGAQDLKALYFDLAYDPAIYRPMVVEPTKAMGDKGNLLQLTWLKERGKVYHGQVITNYEWRKGLTGDATVAQVLFLKQPAVNNRTISAIGPPVANSSSTTLAWDSGTSTLSWLYFNTGDYDQNGEVNIADLTPLGADFLESVAPATFPIDGHLSAVDGDGNGELNIADLTPIGANFQANALGGYNIYESLAATDAPSTATGPNGAGASLTGSVAFADATGIPADVRKAFSFVVGAPVPNVFYWVRPTDGTGDGIASNLVGGNPANAPVLAILNPPGTGNGTPGSPYICDVTTDFQFTLTDPVDGDVSADTTNTVWSANPVPPGSGAFTQASPTLWNFNDAFTGTVTISASYNGTPSNPSSISLRINPIVTGGLEIYPDPADTDWPAISPIDLGTGHDNPYFVLPNDDTTEYSFKADDDPDTVGPSGTPVDVTTLTWTAFPAPFLVSWVTEGTFTSNTFTNAYIVAQDPDTNTSNHVYVERHNLP